MVKVQSDLDWLIPVSAILVAAAFVTGAPYASLASEYSFIALVVGAAVMLVRLMTALYWMAKAGEERPAQAVWAMVRANLPRIICAVIGVELIALMGAAFSTMKLNIPAVVPYYADPWLANFDKALFGADPWRLLYFQPVIPVLEVIYNAWIATQMATIYAVILMVPSQLKTRAILTYVLIWFVVGGAMAYAFSSVGPLFFDRVYGGDRFAGLADVLAVAPVTTIASDMLWHTYSRSAISIAGGMSAMPSMHIGGSMWMALVWGSRFPKLAWMGWAYFALMYYSSVMLGWHYATDGIVAALATWLIWLAVGALTARAGTRRRTMFGYRSAGFGWRRV